MQVQKIRFMEDSDGIFEDKLQKEGPGRWETGSTHQGHESARPKHARTG